MKPWMKGLMLAAAHVALVASLGGKLLFDRATRPRVWVETAPFDPNLPIRGRYVRLQLFVEPRGFPEIERDASQQPVTLQVDGDRLIAHADTLVEGYDPSLLYARVIEREGREVGVLDDPVAFFITEHIPDPSLRAADEELWVEVTVPKKGPPRPIQLGVKTGDGPVVPLDLR